MKNKAVTMILSFILAASVWTSPLGNVIPAEAAGLSQGRTAISVSTASASSGLTETKDGLYFGGKTGWQTINKKKYYFWPSTANGHKKGIAATGWQTINKKKFYFDENGVQCTGVVRINGAAYYLYAEGGLGSGWITAGGKRYYFWPSGDKKNKAAIGSVTIAGADYYFAGTGECRTGWFLLNGKKYYGGTDGKLASDWQTISGAKYYFYPSAVNGHKKHEMATGNVTIKNVKYTFASTGKLTSTTSSSSSASSLKVGWNTVDGKKYYVTDSKGTLATGWKKIGNYYYFFYLSDNGSVKKGQMATGSVRYNSTTYTLNSSGQLTDKKMIARLESTIESAFGAAGQETSSAYGHTFYGNVNATSPGMAAMQSMLNYYEHMLQMSNNGYVKGGKFYYNNKNGNYFWKFDQYFKPGYTGVRTCNCDSARYWVTKDFGFPGESCRPYADLIRFNGRVTTGDLIKQGKIIPGDLIYCNNNDSSGKHRFIYWGIKKGKMTVFDAGHGANKCVTKNGKDYFSTFFADIKGTNDWLYKKPTAVYRIKKNWTPTYYRNASGKLVRW